MDVCKIEEGCGCGGKSLDQGRLVGGFLWTTRKELEAPVKSIKALQLLRFPQEPSRSDLFRAVG